MLCPNCNKETINVNGRNVCVECGTEVPDTQAMADINIASISSEAENTAAQSVNSAVDTGVNEVKVEESESAHEVESPAVEIAPATVEALAVQDLEINTPSTTEISTEDVSREAVSEPEVSEPTSSTQPQEEVVEPVQPSEPAVSDLVQRPDETTGLEIQPPQEVIQESDDTFEIPVTAMPAEVTPDIIGMSTEQAQSEPPYNPDFIQQVDQPELNENPVSLEASTAVPLTIDDEPEEQSPFQQAQAFEGEKTQANSLVDILRPVAQEGTTENISAEPVDPFEVADVPVAINDLASSPSESGDLDQPNNNTQNQKKTQFSLTNKSLYLILGLGILTFVSLLGGGIFAYLNLTKKAKLPEINIESSLWKKYESTDYSVDFPLIPEKSKETITVSENKVVVEKVSAKKEEISYGVLVGVIPDKIKVSADLSEFVNALAKAYNGKVEKNEATIVENEKAADFNISTGTSTIKGVVIIKEKKVYYLTHLSRGETLENYSRFIESFVFNVKNSE